MKASKNSAKKTGKSDAQKSMVTCEGMMYGLKHVECGQGPCKLYHNVGGQSEASQK